MTPARYINLTFHGVGDLTRSLDSGERDVWLSAERFASVLDAVRDRDDVHLSFDDGNASDVEVALPALTGRGLTAVFFVVAGRLGEPGYLGEADIRALTRAGMTIGCHGMRHRPWRSLDDRALQQELWGARRLLEEVAGQPVTQAACPFGSYDRRVLRSLRRYAYERVFTSDRGCARPDRWIQPRNSVRSADGPALIEEIHCLDRPLPKSVHRRLKLRVKRWR